MSEIPSQGQEIIVDPETGEPKKAVAQQGSQLVSWIVGTIGPWRDHRNFNYLSMWAEYWRMWRGQWSPEDRNRMSERSRLIAPALSQAIEMSVAEVEESVFTRDGWFDIADDVNDQDKLDASLMRDQLIEDMDKVNAREVFIESCLNAAIFGTGIVKVNTEVRPNGRPVRGPNNELIPSEEEEVLVTYQSYRADQVIPDPAGCNISDMLGIALEHVVPTHAVQEKISSGQYRRDAMRFLGGAPLPRENRGDFSAPNLMSSDTNYVEVIEYHGKVPKAFLDMARGDAGETPLDRLLADDHTMVEAIVTYANDNVLLKAIPNPFAMRDRAIVAFPWEKVPGRFWGRGVAEKGYNPQKALDAEMRARADALGFLSAPMLGIDAGRIPRGFKPEVKPGKVWLTQGPPNEVLQPVAIGGLEPSTFNQTAELTQMVQMGTGAFDTASMLRGGQTASGGSAANSGSMALGAFVKRAKRAIQNVERNMLIPIIEKTAWRYMQFDPIRYPFNDTRFQVKAALGIVAREIEQLNLTQLIGMLPDEGAQSKLAAAEGFVDLSSVLNKSSIIQAIRADKEQAAQAQQQAQAFQQERERREMELLEISMESETVKNQKLVAEVRKILAEAESEERLVDIKELQAAFEKVRLNIEMGELQAFIQQNELTEKRLDLQEKQLDHKISQDKKSNGSS